MPLLRQENPRIGENLSAMAQRLRLDEQALQEMAKCVIEPDVRELRAMMPALRSRAIENFLMQSGVIEPESEHISLAEALIFSDKPGAKASFPGGVTICRQYDRLTVAKKAQALEARPLSCPQTLEAGAYRITCVPANSLENTAQVFTLPAGDWVIRSRQEGDTIRLSGGTKTLKKLYIDRKIPASQRMGIPVIADENGVAAVWGVGVHLDRMAKDLPAWQITIEKIPEEGE